MVALTKRALLVSHKRSPSVGNPGLMQQLNNAIEDPALSFFSIILSVLAFMLMLVTSCSPDSCYIASHCTCVPDRRKGRGGE